ncbi:hypothetical protein [uncultured Arsenicicoccus sp.]|uniref:hypothetical protein n=1 Tax=uncultured Arsenicicoccus sp. TaxID=491339 RepID=UPI0025915C9F|nr:hypothetical protein [uncultured Arsenicicoccus sp.]
MFVLEDGDSVPEDLQDTEQVEGAIALGRMAYAVAGQVKDAFAQLADGPPLAEVPLVQDAEGFAAWVGAKRTLTSRGNLTLKDARDAWETLQLWRRPLGGAEGAFVWRSAAECSPLDAAFSAAVQQHVEVVGKQLLAIPLSGLTGAEAELEVEAGRMGALALAVEDLGYEWATASDLVAMWANAVLLCGAIGRVPSRAEVRDFWRHWVGGGGTGTDRQVELALSLGEHLGLLRVDGDLVRGTTTGVEVLTLWQQSREEGLV